MNNFNILPYPIGKSHSNDDDRRQLKFINKHKQTKIPKKKVTINVKNCQYPIISSTAKGLGWSIATANSTNENEPSDWDVIWIDSGLGIEKYIKAAKSYQKINHFVGMVQIYRKNLLARSMNKMQKICDEYNFVPKTWLLPFDYPVITKYLKDKKKENCVIVKPVAGAQGRGIFLTMKAEDIDPSEASVVQSYIHRPLLIDGYKFDLRIYVLVTCCDPLRILIYKEGLCRLCTTHYSAPDNNNIECSYMHLTNYSINKYNESFIQNNDVESEDNSSKRSLSWLWTWLSSLGHDIDKVWREICDIVVKTLISIQAQLAQNLKTNKVDMNNRNPFTCFELLGFDILLSDKLKPWLIEVNHMPSFRADSGIDLKVKSSLIEDTLNLLNVTSEERLKFIAYSSKLSQIRLYGDTFERPSRKGYNYNNKKDRDTFDVEYYWRKYLANESVSLGNFDLVYPTDCYANQPTAGKQELYEVLLDSALSIFLANTNSNATKINSDSDLRSNSSSSSNLNVQSWTKYLNETSESNSPIKTFIDEKLQIISDCLKSCDSQSINLPKTTNKSIKSKNINNSSSNNNSYSYQNNDSVNDNNNNNNNNYNNNNNMGTHAKVTNDDISDVNTILVNKEIKGVHPDIKFYKTHIPLSSTSPTNSLSSSPMNRHGKHIYNDSNNYYNNENQTSTFAEEDAIEDSSHYNNNNVYPIPFYNGGNNIYLNLSDVQKINDYQPFSKSSVEASSRLGYNNQQEDIDSIESKNNKSFDIRLDRMKILTRLVEVDDRINKKSSYKDIYRNKDNARILNNKNSRDHLIHSMHNNSNNYNNSNNLHNYSTKSIHFNTQNKPNNHYDHFAIKGNSNDQNYYNNNFDYDGNNGIISPTKPSSDKKQDPAAFRQEYKAYKLQYLQQLYDNTDLL